jgi:hypothetical protein
LQEFLRQHYPGYYFGEEKTTVDTQFEVHPLSESELAELGQHQLLLEVRPVYAPSIIKSYFMGRPWVFQTTARLAEVLNIPEKQVRRICCRLVADGWLTRTISKWRGRTHYYWWSEELNEAVLILRE